MQINELKHVSRTKHYYLMSRFMFPFILIALFFAVLALFLGLMALCTRIGSYLSSLLTWLAWVFQVITTALMTWVFQISLSYFVRERNLTKNPHEAPAMSKAATISIATVNTPLSALKHLALCGLQLRAWRSRPFCFAWAAPQVAKVLAIPAANRDDADSSIRDVPAPSRAEASEASARTTLSLEMVDTRQSLPIFSIYAEPLKNGLLSIRLISVGFWTTFPLISFINMFWIQESLNN